MENILFVDLFVHSLEASMLFQSRQVRAMSSTPVPTRPRLQGSRGNPFLGTCKAAADDDPISRMTAEEASKILGVSSTSSFDEVLSKKNKAIAEAGQDQDKIMQVEAAYDTVFMQVTKTT